VANKASVVRVAFEDNGQWDEHSTLQRAEHVASSAKSRGANLIKFRHCTWKELDKRGEPMESGKTGHAVVLFFDSDVSLDWF
jgi:hypothetical protein